MKHDVAQIAPAQKSTTARLWFLDNLKVALTVLVILHHVGQAYGPTGGFWYFENPDRWGFLGSFFYVNASFFMGLFFFLSAYFLPGSYDRKGAGWFLRDRLVRLGIPLVVFALLVIPVLMYVSYINFRGAALPFAEYLPNIYFGAVPKPEGWSGPTWPELNFAHTWFIEHLLVYALLYALVRLFGRPAQAPARSESAPSDGLILGFTLALTLVTVLVRIPFPIDRWIGLLGFIQMEPAHLPQYLSFFVLGTVAYRRGWLTSLPTRQGMRWLWAGLAGVATVFCLSWLKGLVPGAVISPVRVTAESFIAVGLSLGLITLFRERLNEQRPIWRTMSENAYAAYLFHVPVAVAFQYAAAPLPLTAMPKFLLLGVASVVATFGLSYLIRQIPGAQAVL